MQVLYSSDATRDLHRSPVLLLPLPVKSVDVHFNAIHISDLSTLHSLIRMKPLAVEIEIYRLSFREIELRLTSSHDFRDGRALRTQSARRTKIAGIGCTRTGFTFSLKGSFRTFEIRRIRTIGSTG